ncbi:MAG: pyridoxal phosphate-dependent aminotransferase [Spirochaetes bacterium]|nr:pyridoxal phosphate-dependent aminotransferase [Spirochaetota bacterium]
MGVSAKMKRSLEGTSWIRRMFEVGAELAAKHGPGKVCDFSLGNPDVEPPAAFQTALEAVVRERVPHKHGYMPNAGYPEVRAAVAGHLSTELGTTLSAGDVVMSCGAAGGLNAVLKTLLDPGDEVVASVPYFMEYGGYADNHGGSLVLAPTRGDFNLDVAAIEAKIGPRTAAVIVNSPNNPTGRVYPERTIRDLGAMLAAASRRVGRTVYLVSDEPYRHVVYDGVKVPSVFAAYPHSIVITSYSKDLSLPGERIGCVAVHPGAEDAKTVVAAVVTATRMLGFVNAPALMQRVVARLQGLSVDPALYRTRRDRLYDALAGLGYTAARPEGAFYLFLKAPGGDDLAFIRALQDELVLAVPGRGFGMPGYFRLAYCVDEAVIERSLEGFRRAIAKFPAGR